MLLHTTYVQWRAYTGRSDGKLNLYYGLEIQPQGGFVIVGTIVCSALTNVTDNSGGIGPDDRILLFLLSGDLGKSQQFFSILDAVAAWEYDPSAEAAATQQKAAEHKDDAGETLR